MQNSFDMLKTLNKKLVDNFLKDKPKLTTYIDELYKRLDEEIGRDWYLMVREIPMDKLSFTILELRTGLVGKITEEQVNTLDQNIANCVCDVSSLLFEAEGIVRVTYCAIADLEEAYEDETEGFTAVFIDDV